MTPTQGPAPVKRQTLTSELASSQKALRSAVAQVTKVTTQLHKLKEEQEVLTQKLTTLESEKDLLQSDRDKHRDLAARLKGEIADSQERIRLAQQQLERERANVAQAHEALRADWVKLSAREAQVRSIVEQVQGKNRTLAEEAILREARLHALEAERDNWRQKAADVEIRITKLTVQLEELTGARSAEAAGGRDAREKLRATEQELKSARTELLRLSQELDRAQRGVAEGQNAKRLLEARLADSQHELSKASDEVGRLNCELDHLRNVVDTFEKQRRDWLRKDESRTNELENVSAQLVNARQRNEEEIRAARASLQEALDTVRAELAKAKESSQQNEELKNSLWKELVAAERARDQARKHAEDVNRKVFYVELELEKERSAAKEAEAKHQDELNILAEGSEALREEIAQVKADAEASIGKKIDEIHAAEARMAEMENARKSIEDALLRTENELARSRSDVENLSNELGRVQQQRDELQRAEAAAQAEIGKLRASLDHQKELIQRADASHQSDKVAIERLNTKLHELEDVKFRLSEKLQASEHARDEAHREIVRIQLELASAKQAGVDADRTKGSLQIDLNRAQQDLQRAQQDLLKAQESIARLEAEVKKGEDLQLRMTDDRQALVRRADQAYDEVNALKLAMAKAREDFQRELGEKIAIVQQQLSEAESQRQLLLRHDSERREEVASLRLQVAEGAKNLASSQRTEAALREEQRRLEQALEDAKLLIELAKKDSEKWEALFDRTRAERDIYVQKLEHLAQEMKPLQEKLTQSEERLKAVEAERGALLEREENLREEVIRLHSETGSLKDNLNQERQLKSLLMAEAKRLKEDLVIGTENATRAEEAKKALWEELVSMERVKGELGQHAERLRGEINAANIAIENLKGERAALQMAERDYQRQLKEKDEEIAKAREINRHLEIDLNEHAKFENDQAREIESLSQELKRSQMASDAAQLGIKKLQDELHRAIQSREEANHATVQAGQQLIAAEKESRRIHEEHEALGKRALDLDLEVQRLTQALEQSERSNRELENSYDALSKASLERQLETDRMKRELERSTIALERSERERFEIARREGVARLEAEKFKKIANKADGAAKNGVFEEDLSRPEIPAIISPGMRHGSA